MAKDSTSAASNAMAEPSEWLRVLPPVPRAERPISVLGLTGCPQSHDAAVALIVNNRIVAAVEEERFQHIKHVGAYPFLAIDACLARAGLTMAEVDHVVYGIIPDRFQSAILDEPQRQGIVSPTAVAARSRIINGMRDTLPALEQHYACDLKSRFRWVNHHLAHAASSYYASGLDESLILSVDGGGDREAAALYHGRGAELTRVHSFLDYPQSLGRFYSIVTLFVIGPPSHGVLVDAGKLMGLAAYGNVDENLFADMIDIDEDDLDHPVKFDMSWFSVHTGSYPFSEKWLARFGAPLAKGQNHEPRHLAMAASAQWVLERAMVSMAKAARKRYPSISSLCLSGGTTLNVCANRRILDEAGFDELFIAPAANDAGTALGAALLVNTLATGYSQYEYTVYSGQDIVEDFDIEGSLRSFGGRIRYQRMAFDTLCDHVADRLVRNEIIGWAQGRMEFGPRALGNRSLLANPANPLAKDTLNSKAKKREHFRPYAPSVLAEECSAWFDIKTSPHMLIEASVLPDCRARVPGVVHYDGTSRPQTVTRLDNERYYRLINTFYAKTGIPMLLNTSLNGHGETIVNSPVDAVLFLLGSEVDAVVIGDYVVVRFDGKY
jgi:carbamoyltransferase